MLEQVDVCAHTISILAFLFAPAPAVVAVLPIRLVGATVGSCLNGREQRVDVDTDIDTDTDRHGANT